jgi:hypothetical protein
MSSSGRRVATGHLLDPKPQAFTEQELQHMDALSEVLYGMYMRQAAAKEPATSLDSVLLSPRVFGTPSTTIN